MNASELRNKSIAELKDQLLGLRQEQFNLRMQRSTQQLGNTAQLGQTRRDIARAKTILAEKQAAAAR